MKSVTKSVQSRYKFGTTSVQRRFKDGSVQSLIGTIVGSVQSRSRYKVGSLQSWVGTNSVQGRWRLRFLNRLEKPTLYYTSIHAKWNLELYVQIKIISSRQTYKKDIRQVRCLSKNAIYEGYYFFLHLQFMTPTSKYMIYIYIYMFSVGAQLCP